MVSQISLTPIESVFHQSRQDDKPFPCLKVVKIRPIVGGDVNYKLRLSDGISWVRAYFVNPGFNQFIEDGSIKVDTIIELRKYIQGIHSGGSRYLGIVWLYPYPQLTPEVGIGIVTARQHLDNNPDSAISLSRNTTISNSFSVFSPQLTEEMVNMKRTMLNDLVNKHGRNANFLVVVLGKRQRHDSNSLPKQDWYLWDQNSKDRKTILSVWGELCIDFQPIPGTIIALWNVQINTRYEDNPNSSRLLWLTTGGLGHLNAYKQKYPRFMIDPRQVVGYDELWAAWKEYQHISVAR